MYRFQTPWLWGCVAVCCAGFSARAAAQATELELATLADALELAAVDTGFYVSLETLNDVGADLPGGEDYDFLNNEGGTYVIFPARGDFQVNRRDLLTAGLGWGGPYVNFQQGRTQTDPGGPYDLGSPLDLFGEPYYFFSPLGLVRGDTGQVTLELYGDAFDRYTLVSLGPDGVPSGDDAIRQFGGGITQFTLGGIGGGRSSVRPDGLEIEVEVETTVTLRGYALGAEQGEATVDLDGEAIADIEVASWQSRAVELRFPAALDGTTGTLTVQRGGARTNGRMVRFFKPANAVGDFHLYE